MSLNGDNIGGLFGTGITQTITGTTDYTNVVHKIEFIM